MGITIPIKATVDTRASVELTHLRAGAWAAGKVSVTANRGTKSCTGSEIVVRDRLEASSAMAVIGTVTTTNAASGKVVIMAAGGERATRTATMEARNIVGVVGGLPVNGLHAVLEFSGRLELDLTEDSPGDDNSTNGSGNDDEDNQSGLGGLGGTLGVGTDLSAGGLSGRTTAGDSLGDTDGRL